MTQPDFSASRAGWNRSLMDLESDEVLAQVLDRGEMAVWRELYQLAGRDARLRQRIKRIVLTVPVSLPRFWLAALASLGEPVDLGADVPDYYERTAV
ncbi:MAG: hypothetical protein ACRELA_09535 [Candidatus Rokuibacteriota bacterium]